MFTVWSSGWAYLEKVMSIFDRFLKPSESEKIRTPQDSYNLALDLLEENNNKFVDMSSHANYVVPETRDSLPGVFKFTVKLLSLDFINKLSKDKRVKNVYFAARHSHPGGASDSASLRQRVIIEYY